MVDRGRGKDLDRLAQQYADQQNKLLNLSLRGREKVFGDPEEQAQAEPVAQSTLEGREARLSSMSSSNPCGPGYEWITAPTSGKTDALGRPRPRAYFACYSIDKEMEVLVIGMRDTIDKDNTVIQYDGVDPVLWEILKNSDSTTDFINLYLEGAPWSRTSYSNLPRKRPDEFQFGSGL
jgi:hypothetical protein